MSTLAELRVHLVKVDDCFELRLYLSSGLGNYLQDLNDICAPHFNFCGAIFRRGLQEAKTSQVGSGSQRDVYFAMASPRFSYKIGVWPSMKQKIHVLLVTRSSKGLSVDDHIGDSDETLIIVIKRIIYLRHFGESVLTGSSLTTFH